MTLIKPLEELLKQITDENDRKVLATNFEKYDFLQKRFEGDLRQQDYDKNMNEVKTAREKEKEEAETLRAYNKKMKDWAEKNIPIHEELTRNFEELQTKYKELEEQKAIAVAAAAGDAAEGGKTVDTAALLKSVDEMIEKRGYSKLNQAEIQKIADAEAKKQIEERASAIRKDFYEKDLPGVMAYMTAMNDLQFKNREEFGEPLNTTTFAKFISDNNIADPYKAYEQYTSEKRLEKKIADARKDERDKTEKEIASKMNLPGSGAPAAPELGPLQLNRMGKIPDLPAETSIGDNRAAYAAATELRAEGKW